MAAFVARQRRQSRGRRGQKRAPSGDDCYRRVVSGPDLAACAEVYSQAKAKEGQISKADALVWRLFCILMAQACKIS